MDLLKERGAEISYYDPFVPVIRPTREHPQWTGTKSVSWTKETVQSFDVALIATNHASVNYRELGQWSPCVVDTRNAMAGIPGKVWKA